MERGNVGDRYKMMSELKEWFKSNRWDKERSGKWIEHYIRYHRELVGLDEGQISYLYDLMEQQKEQNDAKMG